MDQELFVTIAMNDGSILHKTKIGFLDKYDVFDWITDVNVLKSIVKNQVDTRMLAFSTNHVQGRLIKQNIKSISVEVSGGVLMRLKRLFCYHKWIQAGNPYLWDCGSTKRVDVKCVKCGKISNVDIFDTPKRRWA